MLKKWIFLTLFCYSSVYATDTTIYYDFNCPFTKRDNTNGEHTLINDGHMISGNATAWVNGEPVENPLMRGLKPHGVPSDLEQANYNRAGTVYYAKFGVIKCHYYSSLYPSFDVYYHIKDGRNGLIKESSFAWIRVVFIKNDELKH